MDRMTDMQIHRIRRHTEMIETYAKAIRNYTHDPKVVQRVLKQMTDEIKKIMDEIK